MDNQRIHLFADDANRNFFKHVKKFSKYEKPEIFDVRKLIADKTDQEEVSEHLAY